MLSYSADGVRCGFQRIMQFKEKKRRKRRKWLKYTKYSTLSVSVSKPG